MTSPAIVQKLWNYCNVLRDDGMSYGDYVEQLTYLLFLKMADERREKWGQAGFSTATKPVSVSSGAETKASKNPIISLDPDVLAQEIVVPRLTSLGTTPSQGYD